MCLNEFGKTKSSFPRSQTNFPVARETAFNIFFATPMFSGFLL